MQKNSGSSAQLLNMEDGESSPQFTSQTPAGMATSAEDTVSQTSELVNEESSSAERKTVEAVFEMLLDFGVHKGAAQSLAEQYDPAEGVKPETYARGAAEAWHYGRARFSEAEMLDKKGFSVDLSEKQRSFAYRIGQVFQRNKTATKEAEIRDMKKTARKGGKNATKGSVEFHKDIDRESLSQRQKVSVEALEKLAKALGAKFRLFQSEIRDGKPVGENGWYDPKTGEIHIDIQAGENGEGTILFTAAHELTHFIYQWSPAKFKILADFLVEQYGKKGQSVADLVRAQQEKAKRNGRKLGWSEAYQEMVADSMETMLSDGKVIEKLMELRARDAGLVQKIRAWFKAFAEKLRAVYRNMSPDTQEGRLVKEMADATQRLQELFTEGLAEAGENYRAIGAQKNTAEEGGVMFSSRGSIGTEQISIPTGQKFDVNRYIQDRNGVLLNDIRTRLLDVQDMEPVFTLDATEFQKQSPSDRDLFEKVIAYFEQIGGFVYRSDLGKVYLNDTGARDSIAHGIGRIKAATFAAIPAVIEKGKMYPLGKYDGRNYDTYLFVAPVRFKDAKNAGFYVGCYVIKDANTLRYKLHEVLTISKEGMPPIQSEADLDGELLRSDIPSSNIISQQDANDNNKNEKYLSDRGNVTSRDVLDQLDPAQISNEIRRKHVQEYQNVSRKLDQEQRNAAAAREELRQLEKLIGREMKAAVSQATMPVEKIVVSGYEAQIGYNDYGKETTSVGAAPAGFAPVGTKPVEAVARVARSAAEAKMTPREFVPQIEQAVVDEMLYTKRGVVVRKPPHYHEKTTQNWYFVAGNKPLFFALQKTQQNKNFVAFLMYMCYNLDARTATEWFDGCFAQFVAVWL